MRDRKEIENSILLDTGIRFNQALIIEILLDIREKLVENSAILNIEHMTEIFREAK